MKTTYFNHITTPLSDHRAKKLLALGSGELRYEMNLQPDTVLAVDWCDDSLNVAAKKDNVVTIKYDITKVCDILQDKSFDTCTLFDVLEHLTTEEATKLIYDLQRVISDKILLFIPIEDDAITEEQRKNMIEMQKARKSNNLPLGYHLSKWTPEGIKELGFEGEHNPCYHENSSNEAHKKWGAVFAVKKIRS